MTKNNAFPAAVVLGLSPTGLHVVRTLGRAGVKVSAISEGYQTGRSSKHLDNVLVETDKALKLKWLLDNFPDGEKTVLIATSDQNIDFIIEYADMLKSKFAFQKSYSDGCAAKIMEKEHFYNLCKAHDVDYPKLWKAQCNQISGLRDEISYPCLIKPSRIQDIKTQMAGKKGWTVSSKKELDKVITEIPQNAGTLLIQEIVDGPESEITLWCGFLNNKSNPEQSFTARKLRQYPPGFGSASLVQSNSEPQTQAIAEGFLKALSYQGIAAAEFKRDPNTGRLKIIEINVRPSLWFSLTTACSRQPVLAAYHALGETGIKLAETPQMQSVRWTYWIKDTWSKAFYTVTSKFILPPPNVKSVGSASSKVWAVYSKDDARPALSELGSFLRKIMQRTLKH